MVKLNALLTKEQLTLIETGIAKLSVSSRGMFVATSGNREGRGSSPRRAIEALK